MGSLVSRRRRRSEVRNASTQATECIPGRVLHGVTVSLEAQKMQDAVTEVTVGDGLPTSPVLRYAQARNAGSNKKRKGFSRVLGGVRTKVKVDRKQQQQLQQPTSRADFSAQYDFLVLPGQVSPTYRRRAEDATPAFVAASEGRKASTAPWRSRTDTPEAPGVALSFAAATTPDPTDDRRTESGKKKKICHNQETDHPKPPKVAARSRIGERSALRDKEMSVAMERRKSTRAASLNDLRAPPRWRAEDRSGQKASGAGAGARDGGRKPSLEVSTAAGKARGGVRKASLEGSTGGGKANRKSTGTEVDERIATLDSTRAAAWESEEQNVDENCNILKEGTLLQDLRNAEIYGACADNDDMAAETAETGAKTIAEHLVNRNNCLLHEEKNDVKQNSRLDATDKGFTEALQMKNQTAASSSADDKADEASFAQVDKSTTFQQNISGELPEREVRPQKLTDVEAHKETEVQVEAEEEEDIAEDTLDWNADDRTRSPSDSRPNSVSSYSNDEDCTIDAIEATANQPQTSLTTLQDSSTHSFPDPTFIAAAQVTRDPDAGGFQHSTRREETDATDHYQASVKRLLPVAWLEKTESVFAAAGNEFIAVPRAPLVMPEETDIYFPASSTDYPKCSSHCNRQQRDVCIQKSSHDHADVCLFGEFMGPHDPSRFRGASTADNAQQTSMTPPNEIDMHACVQELTNDKVGETEFSSPDCKAEEDMTNKLQKVDTKLTSDGSPQKSLLAMQETQAMTLLILTGALPGETESEGAILGAGDAQNLDATSGVDEGQEISGMEGIAVMLRTQSKSSCKLEQLQVADHYASLSRLIDSGLSHPDGEDASDEEADQTFNSENLHCQKSVSEVSLVGAGEEDLNIRDRLCSSPRQQNELLSATHVSLQDVQDPSSDNVKVEQASDSTGEEEDQEAWTLSLNQLSATALEEMQPESILSSSECGSLSTELTTASAVDIEKSSSFPCLEPSLVSATSSEEDVWNFIPLRRVPANTVINFVEASTSSLPTGDKIVEIQSTDAEYLPENQNESKDCKDEVLEAIPQSMPTELSHVVQPYINHAEGDSNPAQASPMYSTSEDKFNHKVEGQPEAPYKEGTGDLLPPKPAVTDPEVVAMEDAAQNGN